MSALNFTFPPPPPPPPKAAPSSYPASGQSSYPQSNGSAGRTGRPSRGRGCGEGYSGPRGGTFRGQGRPSNFGAGPPSNGGYGFPRNTGYSTHIHTNAPTSYPLPEYPREQQAPYRPQQNGFSPYPPLGNYSQPVPYEVPHTHTSQAYNSSLSPQPYAHGNSPYGASQMPFQVPSSQPPIMGPPIRMGFDSSHSQGSHHKPGQPQSHGQPKNAGGMGPNPRYYDHSPPYGRRNPNQRNHVNRNRSQASQHGSSTASQRPPNSLARPQAAPAVPSFGIPLPLKPPPPSDNGKVSRKKKRKHNQLGLTPKADVHESSEEEEDADEEAKLAADAGAGGSEQKQ